MSEKSCPKFRTWSNQYAKKYQNGNPPVTFILLYGIGQTLSSILSPNGAIYGYIRTSPYH